MARTKLQRLGRRLGVWGVALVFALLGITAYVLVAGLIRRLVT